MHDHLANQILAHVERQLEPVREVLRDPEGGPSSVDIAHVAASEKRPVHTLITVGMSSVAMPTPPDSEMPDRIELMMVLPRGWKFDAASLDQEEWNWPVVHLRRLARRYLESTTPLAWGQVLQNDNPPRPLVSSSRLCGVVIVPSLHVPPSFYQLDATVGTITFYAAVPLYAEEMQLALEKGSRVLFEKLLDHDIRDRVDLKRRNVAKKRFGLF